MLMRYRESPEPPPMPLPPGWDEKVMHASIEIGEMVLMASDGCSAEAPRFEGFSLCVEMPDSETAARAFDELAQDGAVQMPLGKTFFSSCFGMVTDRFGVGWMIIVNP
jgi:PhnB protein